MIVYFNFRAIRFALVMGIALTGLAGCVPIVIVGVAAGAAMVAVDRRSSGELLDDQAIGFKVDNEMSKLFGKRAHIKSSVYEGQVLLTGDVIYPAYRARAISAVQSVPKVKTVVDQLVVNRIEKFASSLNDSWLTSKVRSDLFSAKYVPSGSIVVTTTHSVVYLQGKVTEKEANYAANTAASVSGVVKVVKAFHIISNQEALRLNAPLTSATPHPRSPVTEPAPATPIQSGVGAPLNNEYNGVVQSMPVK